MIVDLAGPLRRALRGDGVLQAFLGQDQDSEYKVYFSVAKENAVPPYLLVDVIPANNIVSVYGLEEAMDAFPIGIRSWAETSHEAWQLAGYADDALHLMDISVEPFQMVSIRRTSTPGELPDDGDSGLKQVVVLYDVVLAK